MKHHGDDVCGGSCVECSTDFWNYSYRRKSMGREFFVPDRTLIGLNRLTPKFVLAGTKNSRWERFCLANHTSTKTSPP